MNPTSSLFRELTEGELQAIVNKQFPGNVLLESSLLKGGKFNTTYFLRLAGQPGTASGQPGRRVVLRVGPVNRHLLMDFEQNLMRAEEWVNGQLLGRGVPCSTVIACDTSRRVLDRDYMLVDYIDSTVMCDSSVGAADKPVLYEQIGRYERDIHAIRAEQFGRASSLVDGCGYSSWYGFLMAEVEGIGGKLAEKQGLTSDELVLLCDAVVRLRPLLDEVKIPCMTHTDLWEGNVLLARKGLGWNVAAIIDGDRAVFGDSDYEFASEWGCNEHAMRGYGMDMEAFHQSDRVRRRDLYRMHYHLVDMYVGFMEYNDPGQYRYHHEKALGLARRLTE